MCSRVPPETAVPPVLGKENEMKKFFVVLVAFAMIMGLAACAQQTAAEPAAEEAAAEAEAPVAEEA